MTVFQERQAKGPPVTPSQPHCTCRFWHTSTALEQLWDRPFTQLRRVPLPPCWLPAVLDRCGSPDHTQPKRLMTGARHHEHNISWDSSVDLEPAGDWGTVQEPMLSIGELASYRKPEYCSYTLSTDWIKSTQITENGPLCFKSVDYSC